MILIGHDHWWSSSKILWLQCLYVIMEFSLPLYMEEFGILYHIYCGTRFSSSIYLLELGVPLFYQFILWISIVPPLLMILFYIVLCLAFLANESSNLLLEFGLSTDYWFVFVSLSNAFITFGCILAIVIICPNCYYLDPRLFLICPCILLFVRHHIWHIEG